MATIRPFRAVRPASELVSQIAALPYDVYSSSEARKIVEENPMSFLKIDRAETQLPEGTDMYAAKVYEKAADTLKEMEAEAKFVQDREACYYIYALTMGSRTQRGTVCCVSIDDYLNGIVKKHENTREDKELDRIRHVDTCSAHTGPIFLAYRMNKTLQDIIEEIMTQETLYNFVSDDGIRHQIWKIKEPENIQRITDIFEKTDSLYIADGHHRAASAVKAGLIRREANPHYTGEEEFNYFLSVLFDEEELCIYDYNRIVYGLSEKLVKELPAALEKDFIVEAKGNHLYHPVKKGEFGMYLDGIWYKLTAKEDTCHEDAIAGLDVSILQDKVLAPLLGIQDPKTDSNIEFVGGIYGLKVLQKKVDEKGNAVAFSMYPTSMKELLRAADEGRLMPPKSTWFEPKLRSGLFIHKF